jgi:uncharacterized alkaline shock family protein YloU
MSTASGSNAGSSTAERQGGNERGQTRTAQSPDRAESRPMGSGVALTTDKGSTRIGEGVVAKIAGLAARDIPGVFSMGSGMARRVGQLRAMIPGGTEAASQGVSVEVGEREAAVDLNVVTWYGQSIVEISEAVRRNVVGQIEGMTGLHVVEVNVQVDDIHVESPEDNQPNQQPQRVQ